MNPGLDAGSVLTPKRRALRRRASADVAWVVAARGALTVERMIAREGDVRTPRVPSQVLRGGLMILN